MGPTIGRVIAAGAAALAKRGAKKAAEEGAEEGAKKAGQSVASQAVRNAEANKTSVVDEMAKIDSRLATKKDLAAAQANPARQKAVDEATSSVKGGVKTTEYPYVKPTAENMKKGGSVKSSASRRADGIATKGKTKGRFV